MVELVNYGKFLPTDAWGHEICALVGQIAIAHSQLCHQLYLAPKRIKRITLKEWGTKGEKDFVPRKIKRIRRVYEAKHGNLPGDLTQLLDEILEANEERNAVIHAYWGCTKKDGEITALHRFWKNSDLGVREGDLRRVRDRLRRLRYKLSQFTRALESPENTSKPSAPYPALAANEGGDT